MSFNPVCKVTTMSQKYPISAELLKTMDQLLKQLPSEFQLSGSNNFINVAALRNGLKQEVEQVHQVPSLPDEALAAGANNWTTRLIVDVLEQENSHFRSYLLEGNDSQGHLFYIAAMAAFEQGETVGFNDVCESPKEFVAAVNEEIDSIKTEFQL